MDNIIEKYRTKNKCSQELLNIIEKIIYAFTTVLGEKYIDKILEAFNKLAIYEFGTIEEAGEISNNYFNNGKKYRYSIIAQGGGIAEDDYYIDNDGKLQQKFIVLISKGEYTESKIQLIVHGICHVLSSLNLPELDGNILHTKSGVSETSYEFDGKYKGKILKNTNTLFNEIITENLAMQVMDTYNQTVKHPPESYNGVVASFRAIFRSEALNRIIIDDYMDNTEHYLDAINNLFQPENIQQAVREISDRLNTENTNIKNFLESLYKMSVQEFFSYYFEILKNFMIRPKDIDRETYKVMKQITIEVVRILGRNLELQKKL